jgi:hypothetical protein
MRLKHLVGILAAGAVAFGVEVGAEQYGGSDAGKKAPAAKSAAKSGGPHTMTGCLAKGTEPNTYMLTQIEGNGPKQAELIEVPATLNLAPHVGHKVELTGTAVPKADAEADSKVPKAPHYMKITGVKMISPTCP